ncbi:hypothetical protein [Pseudomonas sp. TSRC2-2]|uniref:hypothetical protein n=1 Tax=unclassified Pseudomonas TaxID=196821 RepID=UPI003CE891EA
MSHIFSDLEKSAILSAANSCKGMTFDIEDLKYIALKLAGASCAPLYQKLFDIIREKVSDVAAADKEAGEVLKSARLWLAVAIDANGGNGAYSALIRGYTSRQGELRLNTIFSEDLMQLSSNQVAVNFINTLSSEGADYLLSGSGDDWLYGEDGADTYVVQAHAGATTTIADVLNPVFHRAEVGVAGWKDEYGLIDQDTVVLPAEAQRDALQLSWGAALIETTHVELEPNPDRGAYRHPPRAKMLHPTLDIQWGGTQKVRIALPHYGELEGAGIELVKFADGSVASLKQLLESSQLGPAPETFHTGVIVNNPSRSTSLRDGRALPLVGGRGNDTISGAGEIRGMQ